MSNMLSGKILALKATADVCMRVLSQNAELIQLFPRQSVHLGCRFLKYVTDVSCLNMFLLDADEIIVVSIDCKYGPLVALPGLI